MSRHPCFTNPLTQPAVPHACSQQSNSLQPSDFLHAQLLVVVLYFLLLLCFFSLLGMCALCVGVQKGAGQANL